MNKMSHHTESVTMNEDISAVGFCVLKLSLNSLYLSGVLWGAITLLATYPPPPPPPLKGMHLVRL